MKKVVKSEEKLIKLLSTVLACPSHFPEYKIKSDPVFPYGKRAIVVCEACVIKMENAVKDWEEKYGKDHSK